MTKLWQPSRLAVSVACAALLLSVASGCGSGNDDNPTTRNATVPPFIPASDVQYIDAIVPHHQMAIEMAQMELDKGTRAEVKAMAQAMKDMQASEIALLKSARQQLTGSADVPAPRTDAHMERDMNGMRNMAAGPDVDAMFLEDMIAHHAEGISLAHRALPNLSRTDVKNNAMDVTENQAAEIGEMQAMR